MTETERRLWWHLRHRLPISGSHFRRQVPIGPFVADFCCLAKRLIIEVDGGQHSFEAQADYDLRRSEVMEAQGFRILRFTNADVMRNIEAVLDTIHTHLIRDLSVSAGQAAPPPPPTPPHKGEGSRSL